MPLFFGGRQYISPVTVSAVNDSALTNRSLAVGNTLAILGKSDGGKPNTPLVFSSPSEAEAVLRGGELLLAVKKAFDPSAQTNGPNKVIAMRVDPATQAALTLVNSASASVITLQSQDYGLYTNQIKVKIEAGTSAGKKLTTQIGANYYSQDNVFRNMFSIQYVGAAPTADLQVSATLLGLQAPLGTAVASLEFATYTTVQQLVDRINTVTGFVAVVLDGNGTRPTTDMDAQSASLNSTAYVVVANLQAVVDWFNSGGEGYIVAQKVAASGGVLVNIPFTYLSGAITGTVTSTEWSNAFTVLQLSDVQWVVPLTSDAAIHAMADAHCVYMSTVGRMERRALVGGATGQTISQVQAAAKLLNSDRTSQCYPGHYSYNTAGVLTLYPSYMTAAMVAAAFAGASPGTALTNKSLKVRGVELELRNPTDTDGLIQAGVLCVENTPKGFKVVQSVSTWLTNTNFNRVEVSTGVALDYVVRSVRVAVDDLRGAKGDPLTMGEALSRAESALVKLATPEPNGPGVIVGNADNPAFKNLSVSLVGDILALQFQCSPVIPVNYIPVTVYAVPFIGSAAA